jgi:thiamine-monophosphate kinase
MTKLGAGGEFDAIRAMIERWGDAASGIGDDAAVLAIPPGEQMVVSVDAFVEGRHFRADWLSPKAIGYRAATAALSDLAAMGAAPRGILFAINLPDAWKAKLPYIADGVAEAARAVRTQVIGGNISTATELSITTTVLGSAKRPLLRSSAKSGDRLYVTGKLGGPGAFVDARLRGTEVQAGIRNRFERPEARISEGQWLAAHGANAAIDISDGLIGDARHLAAASEVGLVIQLDRLPVITGVDPMGAAGSGEEYELLISAPAIDIPRFNEAFGCGITEIGEVVANLGITLISRGVRVDPPASHDHLSS